MTRTLKQPDHRRSDSNTRAGSPRPAALSLNAFSRAALGVGLSIALLGLSSCRSPASSGGGIRGHRHYGAIVDAGSSGSRLFVYEWWQDRGGMPKVRTLAKREGTECSEAGFSETACRLDKLAERTDCSCFHCLVRETRELPELAKLRSWRIELWVKATGGVRRLDDPLRRKVLEEAKSCLAGAEGFSLQGVEVLPGALEGAYAWLAVNDLRGALKYPDAHVGIVEVGGRSAQVAFGLPMAGELRPSAPAAWQIVELELGPQTLPVYTFSRLEGQDQIFDQIEASASGGPSACSNTSKASACRDTLAKTLRLEPRSGALPETQPPRNFVGISSPAYTMMSFQLPLGGRTLADLSSKAEALCGRTEEGSAEALGKILDGMGARYRDRACFSALYSPFLAEHRFGIDPRRVIPLLEIAGEEPSWTRGAMLVEASRGLAARR